MFENIMNRYSPNQFWELQKWIDEWALNWTIQTICDVRRSVELIHWEWKINNDKIINWIIKSWWIFTNRFSNDTWDLCYVDIELLNNILTNS